MNKNCCPHRPQGNGDTSATGHQLESGGPGICLQRAGSGDPHEAVTATMTLGRGRSGAAEGSEERSGRGGGSKGETPAQSAKEEPAGGGWPS